MCPHLSMAIWKVRLASLHVIIEFLRGFEKILSPQGSSLQSLIFHILQLRLQASDPRHSQLHFLHQPLMDLLQPVLFLMLQLFPIEILFLVLRLQAQQFLHLQCFVFLRTSLCLMKLFLVEIQFKNISNLGKEG